MLQLNRQLLPYFISAHEEPQGDACLLSFIIFLKECDVAVGEGVEAGQRQLDLVHDKIVVHGGLQKREIPRAEVRHAHRADFAAFYKIIKRFAGFVVIHERVLAVDQ